MATDKRLWLLLAAVALAMSGASLVSAQSPPGPGQQPIVPQNVPSISTEPSAEATKIETPVASTKPTLPSCAAVIVTPGPVRADGHPWDTLAAEPPDIGIVEATTGAKAQCDDTWSCSLTLTPKSNVLDLELKDADPIGGDDPMGSGTCAIGKTCAWPLANVTVKAC
jgi:hypothetical protein